VRSTELSSRVDDGGKKDLRSVAPANQDSAAQARVAFSMFDSEC
jgi:hypothetical protein